LVQRQQLERRGFFLGKVGGLDSGETTEKKDGKAKHFFAVYSGKAMEVTEKRGKENVERQEDRRKHEVNEGDSKKKDPLERFCKDEEN